MKIFIAHGRNATDDQLAKWEQEITKAALQQAEAEGFSGQTIKVVLARDDFQENAKDGYQSWIIDLLDRDSSGDQRFDAFVTPDRIIGKATATILAKALDSGRPVAIWENRKFVMAKEVIEIDKENWKAGWRVEA